MVVKELEVFNFGQHEHLHYELEGSVIGIVGPNGHGKSTIAQALTYAFLGILPDSYQEVIRHGSKELKVYCKFEKNGKTYEITRSVNDKGKSSRSLFYEGLSKPKYVAKDIDNIMEQLLGADKQTVANSIFISQGAISDIVNNSPSERIDLLVKLLNLNYLNRRSALVEAFIKQLEDKVTPVAPLKELLETAKQDVLFLEQEYNKAKDGIETKYGTREFLDHCISTIIDYEQQSKSMQILVADIETKKQQLSNIAKTIFDQDQLRKFSSFSDIDNLQDTLLNKTKQMEISLTAKENEYKDQVALHKKYLETRELIDRYCSLLNEAHQLQKLKERFWSLSIDQLNKLKYTIMEYIRYYNEYNSNAEEKNKLEKSIVADEAKIDCSTKEIEELKVKLKSCESTYQQNTAITNSLKQLLKTKEQIKAGFENSSNKNHSCPLCGMKLEAGQSISNEDIDKLKSQIVLLENQCEATKTSTNETKVQLQNLMMQTHSLQNSLFLDKLKYKSIRSWVETNETPSNRWDYLKNNNNNDLAINLDIEGFDKGEIDTLNDILFQLASQEFLEYERLNKDASNVTTQAEMTSIIELVKINTEESVSLVDSSTAYNAKTNFDEVIPPTLLKGKEEPNDEQLKSEKAAFIDINTKIGIFSHDLESLQKQLLVYKTFQDELAHHEMFQIEKSIQELHAQGKALELQFSSNLDQLLSVASNEGLMAFKTIETTEMELELKRKEIYQRETSIMRLEYKNNYVYDKITELTAIQKLLNPKDGIVRQYLRYMFSVLKGYVSEYLSCMESNFIIDVDDPEYTTVHTAEDESGNKISRKRNLERGLSFKFLRTDQANAAWLGMNRLSGGQKIKLAIAILISIQKLICPELCFLVLDEPSTHLDEPSIQALSNLLSNLQEMLNISGGQVFVIDHNEILNRSFTTTIQL